MNRKLTFSAQLYRNGGKGVAKIYFMLSKDNKIPELVTATFGHLARDGTKWAGVSFPSPGVTGGPHDSGIFSAPHVWRALVVSHFLVFVKIVFQVEIHSLI